jgi:hypothetical protein
MKTGDKIFYDLGQFQFVGYIDQLTKTHARITIPSCEGAYVVLPIGEISLCN